MSRPQRHVKAPERFHYDAGWFEEAAKLDRASAAVADAVDSDLDCSSSSGSDSYDSYVVDDDASDASAVSDDSSDSSAVSTSFFSDSDGDSVSTITLASSSSSSSASF